MHIVFYGPEGSGKGTQAKLLSQKLKLPLITFGDLVRQAAKTEKGPIGQRARQALLEGKYLADSEAFALWNKRLKDEDAKKGWIIDGFPRSIGQAKFLINKMKKYGYSLDILIYLNLSDKESIKRLSLRKRKLFSGSNINHDDPQRVKERLKVYREKEKPILKYFQVLGVLKEINGEGKVDAIHKNILKSIKQ